MIYRDGATVDAGTEIDTNLYHELHYHLLGTHQPDDLLCWRDPDHPKHRFGTKVTDDGKVIKPQVPNQNKAFLNIIVVV